MVLKITLSRKNVGNTESGFSGLLNIKKDLADFMAHLVSTA